MEWSKESQHQGPHPTGWQEKLKDLEWAWKLSAQTAYVYGHLPLHIPSAQEEGLLLGYENLKD